MCRSNPQRKRSFRYPYHAKQPDGGRQRRLQICLHRAEREFFRGPSFPGGTKPMTSSKLRTFGILLVLALHAAGLGAGGNPEPNPPPGQARGQVYILTTDAPLSCVLSFKITVTSLTLTPEGGGTPVSVLTSPTQIEFARLEGIQNL